MGDIYFTREGYAKLKKEYDELIDRRIQISQEIGTAREHGDLKENAEYHAAREAQGINEARIAELSSKLGNARIIEDADIPDDEVYIGATVDLIDIETESEKTFTLVTEDEADYAEGKISVTSPVGKGLLGHAEGDIVEITVPARTIKYKIIKIRR